MAQLETSFRARKADSTWPDELNPQQREAATHGDGPLLVVAGAGTGKTRTLAYRVSHLISQGVPPGRILLLTFTRRAAKEMLNRAAAAVSTGPSVVNQVWGGTFHSIANRVLRMYAHPAGLSPNFTVIDRSDAEDLLDVMRHDLAFSKKESRFPRKSTCLDIYSRRVNGTEDLDAVLGKEFPWCQMWRDELSALFRAYVERKQEQNVLDYDDLLLYWYYLLYDEKLAELIGGRFDHVMVDEYQDTNYIQAGILLGLRRKNKNLMVVGDDAQSIYSFRSATVRNMLDFPQQFPGTKIVTLEQNYRSVPPILDTTNLVIAQARERYSKDLWSTRKGGKQPQVVTCFDESEQDQAVVDRVLGHYEQGVPLRRQAVLFRAASHSTSLELALTRHNIPFVKYGGLRFFEAAHIKDLIGILRIVENPRDGIAWFRVLQLLDGVGPTTASSVLEHVASSGHNASSIATFEAPAAARGELSEFSRLVEDLTAMQDDGPSIQIDRIRVFYSPILKRRHENSEQRESDIEHLGQIARRYKSRRQFLADLILDPPVSTGDLAGPPLKDEDWLVLSTIHSAKGLEWDVVYLIHAADGCLPSDMATSNDGEIEEELRLAYVAMTRARDFLYVLWPLRYYHRSRGGFTDSHSYAQLCRFFAADVLDTMDQAGYAKPEGDTDEVISMKPSKDISSRIREIWS